MIQSYKKQPHLSNKYDVIVIGSGIGSLTAATLLAKSGKKVLILERHYTRAVLPTFSSVRIMSGM